MSALVPACSCRLSVAAVAGSQATLRVALNEASPDGAILQVTSDPSGWNAAITATGIQTSGWAIYVGGELVDLGRFSGSISVARSYDQQLQTYNFELSLDTPDGAFGSPFRCAGPATGRRTVAVYGVYKLTSGATKLVPLILDGVADNSRREARADGSCVETITGVDRGGRFDQELVTLVLPPGHGFPRGRVLQLLAERAGETQFNLEAGNPTVKEVQVVDGDWLSIATEQHEVENRRVLWDANGYLTNPKVGRPRADEPDRFDFDETDFLRDAPVGVDHKAYVLTDVTLTGSEQIAADEKVCALDPQPPQEVISEAVYSPAVQPYKATGIATIASSGLSPSTAARRVVGISRYQQVLRCGTTVYERTTKWGYKNPLATRVEWNAGTRVWDLIVNRFLPDNDPANLGLAYFYGIEHFAPVFDEEVWHFYMQDGFTYPAGATDERYDHLRGQYPYTINTTTGEWEGDFVGFYLGSITRTATFGFIRKALRSRDVSLAPPYDVFDDLDPITGSKLIGSEAADLAPTLPWQSSYSADAPGSVSTGEALIPVAEKILHVYGDADDKKTRELALEFGWGAAPASPGGYKYGDGTESSDATEAWQELARTETLYASTLESLHRKTTERYAFGYFISGETEPSISGDRPAVPLLPTVERNEAAYASADEMAEFAKYARRMDTKQIKVQVTADGLLTCHFPGILKTDVPWAENEDELAAVGIALIDESAAATVGFTVLANFYLREAQPGRLYFKRLGLDSRARLRSVSHSGPTRGPVLTSCEALVYKGDD